jgi:hypothetical protein
VGGGPLAGFAGPALAFWPRFPEAASSGELHGRLLDRAEIKRLKAQGFKWLSLNFRDPWFDDRGYEYPKYTKVSNPFGLVALAELLDNYRMTAAFRLVFTKDTRAHWYAGRWNPDPCVENFAKAAQRMPKRFLFMPIHEAGLVGDTFTQDELKRASEFLDAAYDRWIPMFPEGRVVLAAPGWSKFHTGDHALMRPRPGCIRQIAYTDRVKEARAFFESRGEKVLMCEGFEPHVKAARQAGIPAALWQDR